MLEAGSMFALRVQGLWFNVEGLGSLVPAPPKYPLMEPSWPLLEGIWGRTDGSWGGGIRVQLFRV